MIIAGIPAYNEEKTIASIILQAQKRVDTVVVCDDGSQDMTAEIAQRLGAIVIRHDKNRGYGAALKSLFEKAKTLSADILVTLDADGQHDAKEIQALIQPIVEGKTDIAVGSRLLNGSKGVPRYRRFGIEIFTRMSNGNKREQKLTDAQCGFRAYNRRAIETFNLSEPGMGASLEILIQARDKGLTITEVPVETRYDGLDTSTLHPVKHGLSLVGTIIRLVVEERPLVYLGIPGAVILLIGSALGVWSIEISAHALTIGESVPTNPLLLAIAFTMVGFFALSTAVTLFAIVRQRERLQARQ